MSAPRTARPGWLLACTLALALAARAPAAAPTSAPTVATKPAAESKSVAAPKDAPAPAAASPQPKTSAPTQVQAAPKASPAAAAAQDWQQRWNTTLEAARREGVVNVSGIGNPAYRDPMMAFQEEFPGIRVEYLGLTGPNYWERVKSEREAGQFLWDLRVGGADPQVYDMKNEGAIDPLAPEWILPEVVDDSKWLGGHKLGFFDNEDKYVYMFFGSSSPTSWVNRDLIPESELSTPQQLLDPKFKGKIAFNNPRGGPGLADLTVFMVAYGEDFVRQLLSQQEVAPTSDQRQLVEFAVRGRYPIVLGLPVYQLRQLQQEGLGQNVRELPTPPSLTAAAGGIQLMNKRPNPNAAAVFVNWLLSPKAQEAIAKSTGYNSRRLDVPPADPEGVIDANRLDQYINHTAENLQEQRRVAQQLAQQYLR